MKWKEAGEALGVASIVGSLIFVAQEVRQNSEAVRSSLLQSVAEQSFSGTTLPIESADLRAALLANMRGDDLNDDEEFLVYLNYTALMSVQQHRFRQGQLGFLDENTLLGLGGRGGAYRQPAFARFWAENSHEFPDDFRDFVERELLPLVGDTVGAGSR